VTTTLTALAPIRGVEYDKERPETRQPWLDQRAGGITATEIRDWGNASKRRDILQFKLTGQMEDLTGNPYVNHGNLREPVIADWVHARFGIAPCDAVYTHPEHPRWLASPDGVSFDPFSGELVVGPGATISEIKTSKDDLNPGQLSEDRVLVQIEPGSPFDRKGYFIQMQWSMLVMNASRCLFVWEQHNGQVDPETQTFTPIGVPEYAWIERDQKTIDALVENVAAKALAEIDAARTQLKIGELPPASDLPAEDMVLVMEVLQARTAEATAKTARERAWKALEGKYVGEGKPDMKLDVGPAHFTVSTSTPAPKVTTKMEFDEAAARRKAPALMAKYDALVERFTKPVDVVVQGEPTQKLTITAKKGDKA
jgi:hypothetical protein